MTKADLEAACVAFATQFLASYPDLKGKEDELAGHLQESVEEWHEEAEEAAKAEAEDEPEDQGEDPLGQDPKQPA